MPLTHKKAERSDLTALQWLEQRKNRAETTQKQKQKKQKNKQNIKAKFALET